MTDRPAHSAQHCLIFGFSNVARTNGFAPMTIEKMAQHLPEVRFSSIGMGAALPYAVPPFLRLACDADPTITHVLLEICTSAFPTHPLATDAGAREVLRDVLSTCLDLGLTPAIMLHPRQYTANRTVDFNAETHAVAQEYGVACLDLAEPLEREIGAARLGALLKDDTHTNDEGSEFIAGRTATFLSNWLRAAPSTRRGEAPMYRRIAYQLNDLLPDYLHRSRNIFGIEFPWTVQHQDQAVTLTMAKPLRVLAMSYLYTPFGGQAEVTLMPQRKSLPLQSVDTFSYFPRIGLRTLGSFDGTDITTIEVSPMQPLEVKLLKGDLRRPMQNFLGPLIVMEKTSG